jgi:alkylation response protein AidB-like acyl-CoA dehydrogenase
MEIKFTPEEERFRAQARAWLEANAPRELPPEHDLKARRAFDLAWQRKLFDAGYAGISWPKEYGGRGATLMEQLIWYEEFARTGAHEPSTLFVGLNHGGPTLIACGNEAQKSFHLPKILRGEVVWCQGFSEPGAGSDLGGLSTRAVVDGDDLVVTGQKIWTSFAHIAEYQELLVRTDPEAPKHKGISWVICPMDTKGIEIRPIKTMGGGSDFCEVFYDEVRIPRANVVGKLNDGWRVAMSTLSFERGTAFLAEQVRLATLVGQLIELARRTPHGGVVGQGTVPAPGAGGRAPVKTALDDDEIARRLALARAEVEALRSMTYRSVSRTARTGVPSAEASLIRLFFSELQQRVHALAMDILGSQVLRWDAGGSRGDRSMPTAQSWVSSYLLSFASTIAAGSKDIQRNIIGDRILGLPR